MEKCIVRRVLEKSALSRENIDEESSNVIETRGREWRMEKSKSNG